MYSERQSHYNESEPKLISPALERFSKDLNTLSNGISLDMAFQKYIRDELDISEVEADMMHRRMQQAGVVPEVSDDDNDYLKLKNAMRIAIFTQVHPFYAETHSTEDYDKWLPKVFNMMLTGDDLHDSDICFRTNGTGGDDYCEFGACPLRTIENATKQAYLKPDFASCEYITDPDTMHRRSEILLTHAVSYKIIPKKDIYTLESHYERQCKTYFGRIGE